jgi:hypothetical protein
MALDHLEVIAARGEDVSRKFRNCKNLTRPRFKRRLAGIILLEQKIQPFRVSLQPHSRTPAVSRNKFDAGGLEGSAERRESRIAWFASTTLKVDDRSEGDVRCFGKRFPRPLNKSPRRSALSRS